MDSFGKCRLASEKVAWSFDDALGDLSFDYEKNFLPSMLCGKQLPSWISPAERRTLNQVRGYSYAHIFEFVEEFILRQTCQTATNYVHKDIDAVSAVLNFANEETKHQRMFVMVKSLIEEGLGFRPGELPNKEDVARSICEHSPFAVYLLILAIEWLTQRHYIECFSEEESSLDAGFVRIFRLHWTEEAQHARLDALELQALADTMSRDGIEAAVQEFVEILHTLRQLLAEQDELDLASFETALGKRLDVDKRRELLQAMHKEYLWTFIVSGLEHKAFQLTYNKVVPEGICSVLQLSGDLGASLSADGLAVASPTGRRGSGRAAGDAAAAESVNDEGTRRMGIALVIDDQEHIREFARLVLDDLGFEVLTAENGDEGLRAFEARRDEIAFVLLDMTMPGMSGGEVSDVMASLNPAVPVVLSSGHMRDDALGAIPQHRLAGYLQKPYLAGDLENAVKAAGRSSA